MTLSTVQQGWLDAALANVDAQSLQELIVRMTAIPSPTGAERPLAEFLVAHAQAAGMEATYQRIDDEQGNAVARLRGDGTGADLLLYAPIDAAFAGDEAVDGPWVDFSGRPDWRPMPVVDGDYVIGLSAENPKGHAACVVMAGEALARARIPLRGDLLVGLGAGGMPVNRSPLPHLTRANIGQGNGCSFMLEQGVRPDFAVIAKPGAAVAYEEVGLCWFKIAVRGKLDYSGRGHHPGYKNPILDAMKVIAGLEEWLPQYTARNTSGLVAPKGNVTAIEAGWPEKLAFVPAACNVYVDLRISPRTDPADAHHQLEEALHRLRTVHPELDLTCTMILAIPGGSTSPENWIVTASTAAWESTAGKPHAPRIGTSGATDANILRQRGIPTARLGMPPLASKPFGDTHSMGVVSIGEMVRLTRTLVTIAIDTCTRPRAEVGLPA